MGLLTFYKQPQPRGFDQGEYLIEDTDPISEDFFQITEFPDVVGGGRYLIKLKGNGPNLRANSNIGIEIKDADGNNIFAEVVDYVDRFDDYFITIEIYDRTPRGIATVYLVGEAEFDIPKFERDLAILQRQLTAINNQITPLQQQFDQALLQRDSIQQQLSEIPQRIESIERFLEPTPNSIRVRLQEAKAEVQRINGYSNLQKIAFYGGVGQANDRRQSLEQNLIPNLEDSIQKAKDDLTRFKELLQTLNNDLAEIEARLPQIQTQLATLTQEFSNKEAEIENLEPEQIPRPVGIGPYYNVRWSRTMNVLPFERNTAELVFNNPPEIGIVQVTVPEREFIAAETTGSVYSVYTSSADDYTIISSNFKGYDRDFGSNDAVLDNRLQGLLLNPLQKPSTNNSVNSSIREKTNDIENGFQREYTSRFNTVVKSANRTLQKDFLGGTFEFFSSESTPTSFKPTLPSNYTVSGSTADQLTLFNANIIEVMTDTEMRISKPIEVVTFDSNISRIGYTTKQRYKETTNFTASITYLPSDAAFVTSSTVSQSYLETTFSDLKPISGEIYRIKTYYKRGTSTGDFKLIYDNVVTPVEYLTDAQFPNQTTYAKRDSDFRLIGHFTTDEIANNYWEYLVETPRAIYPGFTPEINSSSLHESLPVECDYTHSGLLAPQFNQNYNIGQVYTLGFNLVLDPHMELELYMNSDPLSTNTSLPLAYTRAFIKDTNLERTRYTDASNRFGKFVGRVKNDRGINKNYSRVEFDFQTDASGLGRPVFRVKPIGYKNTTGSAYVSEISIKPLAINGFSPNLVQYQIPFNTEIDEILAVSQSLDFKIEYFDYTGKQSEYVTYINDLQVNVKTDIPSNTCQDQTVNFMFPIRGRESGSAT